MEWLVLRKLLVLFSGDTLPDVDEVLSWGWVVPAALSAFTAELFWAFTGNVWLEVVQLGGDVLGLAPGLGLLSCSLCPGELLGPLAVDMSRLTAGTPVPLTTGVPVAAVFDFVGVLRSPDLVFTFFALDAWLSPGLLAVPTPSDFMAEAALQEEENVYSDTLWVLFTGGCSGTDEGHFTALDCRKKLSKETLVK